MNSLKRKYPRKQDKTKIKRTIRDSDPEGHPLFGEQAELDAKLESPTEAGGERKPLTGSFHSMVAFSADRAHAGRLFGKASEKADGSCRHPVYVCKACNEEFPNHLGKPYRCLHCRRGFYTDGELKQHVVRAKHDNLCDVCGKIFPDKYKLRKHALSHVTEKKFKCEVPGCTKAFKSANDVKTHVKYVHATEKRFKCAQCPRAFSRPDKYKLHVLTHGAASPLSTSAVPSSEAKVSGSARSPVNDGLPLLARSNSNDAADGENDSSFGESNLHHPADEDLGHSYDGQLRVFGQEAENTSASTTSSLDLPAKGDGSSRCLNRSTQSNESLSDAAEEGNSTRSRTSGEMTESSALLPSTSPTGVIKSEDSNPLSLNHSNATNTSTNSDTMDPVTQGASSPACPNFLCDHCGRQFKRKEDLLEHAQEHAAEETSGAQCERCKMRFLGDDEFRAHEERRPDHVLRCERCSLKFLSACELCCHQRETHDMVLTDVVAKCARDYGGDWLAQDDAAASVARQPHQKHVCADCGKGFTRADKLRRHAIIHSPDRPCIPCKCRESHDCALTFYRKDSMNRHALTHTLEKPYKCDICDKTFSRQDYVTKHISHVHKRVFKHRCTLCDYGTREPKRLRIHIRSRHELDPDNLLPPASSGTKDETGFDASYPDEYPQALSPSPLKTLGDAVPTENTWFDGGKKVQDLDTKEPLRLSDTPEVEHNSVSDGKGSEYVGDETELDPSPSSTISESVDQQYSVSAVIRRDDFEPMDQEVQFSLPSVVLSDRMKNVARGEEVNAWKSKCERKTPLNSL